MLKLMLSFLLLLLLETYIFVAVSSYHILELYFVEAISIDQLVASSIWGQIKGQQTTLMLLWRYHYINGEYSEADTC
jgi:hypothetical protein